MTMDRRHTGSVVFFRGCIGECRTLSELWGLGRSDVVADVSPWHGDYLVTFPEAAQRSWLGVSHRVVQEFTDAMSSLFSEGNASRPTDALSLQRAHGLTRAEARVVSRLASGLDVPAIAAELRVSVETVRSHLKHAYAKTGTKRQAELVRMVLVDSVPE
jgi:DNA-binding CsgD family transcriptional regulator